MVSVNREESLKGGEDFNGSETPSGTPVGELL